MKHFSTALVIVMTTGMLLAAETKKAVLPGSDDLSRYVATKACLLYTSDAADE